jgi:Ca2+-binding EF-hand superfamily protein
VLTEADFKTGGGGRNAGGRGAGGMDPNTMIANYVGRQADRDRDGKVTKAEWAGWLKTVGEQGITADEAQGSAGGRAAGANRDVMLAHMLVRTADADRDGTVTAKELEPWFTKLDKNQDGELAGDELSGPPAGGRGATRGGRAPQKGDAAPDFDLPVLGSKTDRVKLSSFAGTKPVALIFGSYT